MAVLRDRLSPSGDQAPRSRPVADRRTPGGADWEREIEQKLRACDIFILLVSRHSLSSDYIVDKEIAIIRERQVKGEAGASLSAGPDADAGESPYVVHD